MIFALFYDFSSVTEISLFSKWKSLQEIGGFNLMNLIKIDNWLLQWSTTNWCFEVWLNNTLKNNTIRCKKLAIIVLGRKNVAWRFFRRKQGSMSAEMLLLLLMLCRMPLLLHFGTRAYLFSPEEGSCYVFSTRNNCCELLAFYGVITQSVIQSW